METGPDMTSQMPSTESLADEVVVEDVTVADSAGPDIDAGCAIEASSADDVSTEVVTDDVVSHAIMADTDEASEQSSIAATPGVQEAPAPQAVALFDLGDDLVLRPTAPAFDMTEENVERTVSDDIDDETVIEATNDVVETNVARAEDTVESTISTSIQEPSPVDDEIFEQVMGSSRADDIPLARRSTPGSIPLPPQLAEEQARRNLNASPAPVDTRGRRHPLPETDRTSRRPATATHTTGNPRQPATPPAVDVLCPKCQRTTSTRFTFCMKCGTDFPVGYVASLTGHHPQPTTPGSRDGVRDTRTTVRQINRIHEGRANGATSSGGGNAQFYGQEEWIREQSGLAGNPFLASFLSFLMPGLGHMMIGEHKKGLPWLFAGIAAMAFLPSWTFLMWIPLLLRFASATNAYQLAVTRQDDQREPFDMDDDA